MTELSPKEVRTEAVKAMGSPLGELYDVLSNQVTWVHLKCKEYRALFATSKERIEFLNEAAPAFFGGLQRTLLDDVLLHLCRLTDPPKLSGKRNLTIECLPELISDPSFREEVKGMLTEVKGKTNFAREWRNRRLAHREFPVLATADLESPTPGNRQDVETALASIRTLLNRIALHFMKSSVLYEHSIEDLGGVPALLNCLEKGVDAKRRRKGLPPLNY